MAYPTQTVGQLGRVVAETLTWANEPRVVAKYTNDHLHSLIRANYRELTNEILRLTDTPFLVDWTMTVDNNTELVELPPNVGTIIRIFEKDDATNLILHEYFNNSKKSMQGPGFMVEGSGVRWLHLFPKWVLGPRTLHLWYVPNGDIALATGTITAATNGFSTTTARLSTAPTDGYFDTRPNCYLGGVYRMLTGNAMPAGYSFFPTQERIITAYANSGTNSPLVTMNKAFDFDPSAVAGLTQLTYEVVPEGLEGVTTTLSLRTALTLHRLEGNTNRANLLMEEYRSKMRDIRLAVANLDSIRGNRQEQEVASASMDPWGYAWNSVWGVL